MAKEEIKKANELQIITPNLKRNYKALISREELCELIIKIYEDINGSIPEKEYVNPFTDTNNENILKAYDIGIINGVSDNLFDPNKSVTREELSVMIYRTFEKSGINLDENLDSKVEFGDDDEISIWAIKQIKILNQFGIINGVGNNEISPKALITREQAIIILLRAMEKMHLTKKLNDFIY